jgi:hypothetical protein
MFKIFKYAKVGDTIYNPIHEGGNITKVENEKIYITFKDGFDIIVDLDGKEHKKQKNPSIEWCGYDMLGEYRLKDIIFHYVEKKPYNQFSCGYDPTTLYYSREKEKWYWDCDLFLNENCFPIFFDNKNDDGLEELVDILNKNDANYFHVFEALVELERI